LYKRGLERSELSYRALFESSGMAIGVLEDGRLVKANHSLTQLFDLQGNPNLAALSPTLQPDGRLSSAAASELYLKARREKVSTVWWARTQHGEELQLELSLFPLPQTSQVALTALDVTDSQRLLDLLRAERKSLAARVELRSAELLRANAEITQSVRAKREFIAHLSHELKTPLTALLAQSETLLEGLYGSLNPRQEQAIVEMRDSGERLSRLILDLLDLNRMEAGKMEVHPQEIVLGEHLEEAIKVTEPIQNRRGVECQREGDESVTVRADPTLLRRVLTLLLGRAARQTEEGGTFGVRVETWEELNRVDLAVWNTGIPLTQDALNTLFDLYAYRSEGENKAETGIGLAVAANLLRLLHGDLTVNSGDEGTTLTASLPLVSS
jgi:PAS domain S-box-containing protein